MRSRSRSKKDMTSIVELYALSMEDLITLAKMRVSRSLTPDERWKYLHETK